VWICEELGYEEGRQCVRKNLTDFFHWSDLVVPIILLLIGIIASTGGKNEITRIIRKIILSGSCTGILGSSVFISLLIFVGSFDTVEASPLSQVRTDLMNNYMYIMLIYNAT